METQKEEKIIMYASDEAATLKTVEGWISSDGRFWGKDEHMARWSGSTHSLCDCGKIKKNSRTICDDCLREKQIANYNAMPFKEWDGKSWVYSHAYDKYFNDSDEIEDFINDFDPEETPIGNLQLIICEPNHLHEIDFERWDDVVPEDWDIEDCMSKELVEKIKEVNEMIRKEGAVSWTPGKTRTEYNTSTI